MASDSTQRAAQVNAGFFCLCITIIIVFTLTPFPEFESNKSFDLWSLYTIDAVPEALANILLFLPLGVALAFRNYRLLPIVLFGTLFSLAIEITQFLIPGRKPSLQDVCFNTIGTFLGFRVACSPFGSLLMDALGWCREVWERLKQPNTALAKRLLCGAVLLAVGVFGLTTYLLAPIFPEGPYLFAGKEMDVGATPLRIGASGDGVGYYKGAIDEVRIYDRVLAPEDIQVDMERPVAALLPNSSSGLVAAYGFEEQSSDHVFDISGQGNDGLLDGAVQTEGRFGKALAFNGSDQVIIAHAPVLNLKAHGTLEAWVRPKVNPNGWPTIIQKGGDHYFLYAGPGLIPGGGGTFGGAIEGVQVSNTLPEGVWSHLAMTYDGSVLRLYINAHQAASFVRWFQGRIDEMSVGGIAVHPGLIVDASWLEHALLTGEIIQLSGITGTAASNEGSLLDIQDSRRAHVLELVARGNDLVLQYLTVATALGLPSPEVRVGGALRDIAPESPLNVELSGTPSGYSLSVNGVVHHGLGFALGMGWAVLLHSEYLPPWFRKFFNIAWMAGWAFPVGFWFRMSLGTLVAVVIFGGSLWVLPVTGGLVPTPPALYAAAILGFLSGIGIRLNRA